MIVDIQIRITDLVNMMQAYIVARQLGQRSKQLSAGGVQVLLGFGKCARTHNAVRLRVERYPHRLCVANRLVIHKERETAVPACTLDARTPRFTSQPLIRQQRTCQPRFHTREHPHDPQIERTDVQRFCVDGRCVLHDIPQEGRLGNAAVVNVAVIHLIFTGE